MNNPARTYRENAVRAASPVGLIVILYEEVVRSLRRAQRGIQQGNIEQRTLGLTHAVGVIGHLQSVLNFDNGGDVARNLSTFYNAARTEILRAGNSSEEEAIGTIAAGFSTLAETWKQVDREIGDASTPNDGAHLNPAIYSAQHDDATVYVRG